MKKTIRTIMTALIIAILSLTISTAAFAANATIKWYDEGSYVLYTYGGKELEVGTTEIINTNYAENLVYFGFEAENDGYYHIFTEKGSWIRVPDSYDGTSAQDNCEYVEYCENNARLYYLEKGETVIGLNFYNEETDTITVEYLGEKIVDYTVEEDELDCYIIGWDVWEEDMEYFGVSTDTVITFSSGKTFERGEYFEGTCDSVPKTGKNKATLEYFGVEKEVEFTAYYITDIIESAEITNPEKYTNVKLDSNNNIHSDYYPNINAEILTVTFKDGTVYTVPIDCDGTEVVLPNGKSVCARFGIYTDDYDENVFGIKIAGTLITEYELEYEEMLFDENVNTINDDTHWLLIRSKNYFINGFRYLVRDPEFSCLNFKRAVKDFVCVLKNNTAFIECVAVIF